ncbi:MAG: exosome nuclease subunit [Chaenotheca gracillima]|nr:MAG: exosome nuclease subunit [Chaenotheca gracillima]
MLLDREIGHHATKAAPTCAPTPSTGPPAVIVGKLTSQHLFLLITALCAIITLISSLSLILMHLRRYTVPPEQRQIVRIVFTPAFFAITSCLSILSYKAGFYIQPVQNLYEAYALGSMFYLLVQFTAPEDKMREHHFYHLGSKLEPGQQVPGGNLFRFNWAWIMVFQYTVVKPILVIAQDASIAAGTYCATSRNIHFAHIWIVIFDSISSALAVVAVFRFYARCKKMMGDRKPLTKLLCFKAIVFLCWIQSIIFGFLPSHLSYSAKTSYDDLNFGVPNLIIGLEMVIISLCMHFAYKSSEYKGDHVGPRMGIFRAAAHAINPSDLIRGIVRMVKLITFRSNNATPYAPVETSWPQNGRRADVQPSYPSQPHAQNAAYAMNQQPQVQTQVYPSAQPPRMTGQVPPPIYPNQYDPRRGNAA